MRSGYKEGVGGKGEDSVLGALPLSPLSVAQDDSDKVMSVRPTPRHGRWPSSSIDALTAVVPSSPRTGCSLQPTAKRAMKA